VPSLKGVLRGELMYGIHLPEMMLILKKIQPSFSKTITGKATRDIVEYGVTRWTADTLNWLQNKTMAGRQWHS